MAKKSTWDGRDLVGPLNLSLFSSPYICFHQQSIINFDNCLRWCFKLQIRSNIQYFVNNLFWYVCSGFKDLFDWKHFIEILKDDIQVVETLPSAYAEIEPFSKTPISWSKVNIKVFFFLNLKWYVWLIDFLYSCGRWVTRMTYLGSQLKFISNERHNWLSFFVIFFLSVFPKYFNDSR